MTPEAFNGSMDHSCLKFQHYDLEHFELKIDNQPMVGHPIKMNDNSAIPFYSNYLLNTNRLYNVYSSAGLTYSDYRDSNFLVYTNLKRDGYEHGQLTLKLRFKAELSEKLYLLYMPVYDRKLAFDSFFNPTVTN